VFSKKLVLFLIVAILLGLLAACGAAAEPTPETVTVVETVIVEKEVEGRR
jgi:hypothetical protein